MHRARLACRAHIAYMAHVHRGGPLQFVSIGCVNRGFPLLRLQMVTIGSVNRGFPLLRLQMVSLTNELRWPRAHMLVLRACILVFLVCIIGASGMHICASGMHIGASGMHIGASGMQMSEGSGRNLALRKS